MKKFIEFLVYVGVSVVVGLLFTLTADFATNEIRQRFFEIFIALSFVWSIFVVLIKDKN